eukprot:5814069-Prymnesium_polylepis.1
MHTSSGPTVVAPGCRRSRCRCRGRGRGCMGPSLGEASAAPLWGETQKIGAERPSTPPSPLEWG